MPIPPREKPPQVQPNTPDRVYGGRTSGTRTSRYGGVDKIAWGVIGLGIIVYLMTRTSSHESSAQGREMQP